jgi:hypothetical protein
MERFHSHLASLEMHKCCTCLEAFPSITIASGSTECVRCYKDDRTPKRYSAANNMNPGPVPSQLQVKRYIYSPINCDQKVCFI